jgi:hypothetical protein
VLTDSSCISVLAAKDRASQKGPGMTAFYRNMLDADEEKHAAAVAASSKSATRPNQGPSLAIRPPDASDNTSDSKSPATFDDTAEEDPFIRRERQRMEMERAMMTAASASVPVVERLPATASTEEERIEINDEGAIVDKRVLLKAGLNITKKPVIPKDGPGDIKRPEVHVPLKSRAVGTDASYEARMARERRRLADQMKDEQEPNSGKLRRRPRSVGLEGTTARGMLSDVRRGSVSRLGNEPSWSSPRRTDCRWGRSAEKLYVDRAHPLQTGPCMSDAWILA